MRKTYLIALFVIALVQIAQNTLAEVNFGYAYRKSAAKGGGDYHDFATQAEFFASSDYKFTPGKEDPLTTQAFGGTKARDQYTRGQKGAAKQAAKLAFHLKKPWLSGPERTVFGLEFKKNLKENFRGQFKCFPDGKVEFDTLRILWGDSPPTKGAWGACVLTKDNEIIKLAVDEDITLYPFDRSTLKFKQCEVKKVFVALKGTEDGLNHPVEVMNIHLLAANPKEITNRLAIFQPDAYFALYSRTSPGLLKSIEPVNPSDSKKMSNYITGDWSAFPFLTVFYDLGPVIRYQGELFTPEKKATPVKCESSADQDHLQYELSYKLPGVEKPVKLLVETNFNQSVADSVEFTLTCQNAPDGASIGFRSYGVAGNFAPLTAKLTKGPVKLELENRFKSKFGDVEINFQGAGEMKAKLLLGTKMIFGSKKQREPRKLEKIEFLAFSDGPQMKLSLSLPIGPQAKVCRDQMRFKWYQGSARQGEEGLAPFKKEDLELVEVINCGDSKEPHTCYDSINDPLILALTPEEKARFIGGKRKKGKVRSKKMYGYLPFIDNQEKGPVPIKNIGGKPCRVISDDKGHFFRYDLENVPVEKGAAYLIVVEHAFDRLRRGSFHSLIYNKDPKNEKTISWPACFLGGFDTGEGPHSGKLKKESVLCITPSTRSSDEGWRHSIVFSNVWQWGGWKKAHGPAIHSIEIYKVKRMPKIPDLAKTTPIRQQRLVCSLLESSNPLYLYVYPKIAGYNDIWTYQAPASRLLGGTGYTSNRVSFAPLNTGRSLKGFEWLHQAASKENIFVKTYLGQLLFFGYFPSDRDSFAGGRWLTRNGQNIPLSPRPDELKHIAGALNKSLSRLAKYDSLRDVSLGSDMGDGSFPWTKRNLEDFARDEEVKLEISACPLENAHNLLKGDREIREKWMSWSGKKRFEFYQWLLKEIRQYRKDLFITINSDWYMNELSYWLVRPEMYPSLTRQLYEKNGLTTPIDYLRFKGFDSERYRGADGFAFEIGIKSNICGTRYDEKPFPNIYEQPWFKDFVACFEGGISVFLNFNYDESVKPYTNYTCVYFANRVLFRKQLILALLKANARSVTLASYLKPWAGRLDDLREFSVAFRQLPFVKPAPYEGKVTDKNSQAAMRRYGERYALMNAGSKPGTITVELPPGKSKVYDLSDHAAFTELKTFEKNGKIIVEIPMKMWDLRVLAFEKE